MEIFVTAVLDYNITVPTRLQFLERVLFAANLTPKESMFSKYLLELSLHVSYFVILYVLLFTAYSYLFVTIKGCNYESISLFQSCGCCCKPR